MAHEHCRDDAPGPGNGPLEDRKGIPVNIHVKSFPGLPGATSPFGRKVAFAVVGGGVLVSLAIGANLYSRSGNDEATAPSVVSNAAPPANESSAAPLSARPASQPIYLVSSEERAVVVLAGITEANDILASLGEAPALDSVVVVPQGVEATEVLAAVAESDRVLAGQGLNSATVVDLR